MVGVTLGLPAGYFGGKSDTTLSFLANLVLAFPVILLFYLLVTPGITDTPVPYVMAGVLFIFPVIFFCVLFNTRFKSRPERCTPMSRSLSSSGRGSIPASSSTPTRWASFRSGRTS